MSRSRDGTWFTTRSPIRIAPSEIASSPATIREAVVFPQPDGPTSTMNSPVRDLEVEVGDGARAVGVDLAGALVRY